MAPRGLKPLLLRAGEGGRAPCSDLRRLPKGGLGGQLHVTDGKDG